MHLKGFIQGTVLGFLTFILAHSGHVWAEESCHCDGKDSNTTSLLATLGAKEGSEGVAQWKIQGTNYLNGQTVKLSETQPSQKGIVVLFLSAKCPCSHSHMDIITEMAKKHDQFAFVAIHSNKNESVDSATSYFVKSKLPFPVIRDEEFAIANRFKAVKTPHVFVLSPTGRVLYQGGITNSADATHAKINYLDQALTAIEEGRLPDPAERKTLGCYIER